MHRAVQNSVLGGLGLLFLQEGAGAAGWADADAATIKALVGLAAVCFLIAGIGAYFLRTPRSSQQDSQGE
jgi:hypothetical protein